MVAIPAKNESERIGDAMYAVDVAASRTRSEVHILVLANNCCDETEARAREAAQGLRYCQAKIVTRNLPPMLAHAGAARRGAVAAGLIWCRAETGDTIVSTDADARFRSHSLALIEHAIEDGDDLVLAKIEYLQDPFDPAPDAAIEWGRPGVVWRHRVRRLVETVRTGRIAPAHLHDDYGGAGIAIRVGAYRALGGFAAIPSDEDLRLVSGADRAGMRVNRHSGAVVDVLTRARGRAVGGMADTFARNASAAASGKTCMVEHHAQTIRRIRRNPSHAEAFATEVTHWEVAESAISGIETVIETYGMQHVG